jgi:hypothetical protein
MDGGMLFLSQEVPKCRLIARCLVHSLEFRTVIKISYMVSVSRLGCKAGEDLLSWKKLTSKCRNSVSLTVV